MSDRHAELRVARAAVRAAARICRSVQETRIDANTIEKKDKSPVTVADFAAQSIVCRAIQAAFPSDLVVGEENADELRNDAAAGARQAVVEHVGAELGAAASGDEVLGWIDRGGAAGDTPRYWTLDPIDGTKGFLRGDQYAVALGLIEDGEVVLGVLGCPNLSSPDGGRGGLFSGVAGGDARSYALWDDSDEIGSRVSVAHVTSTSEARFCESVESGHSNQSESAEIARLLGISGEPHRIDSQCKYAAVARGDASIYLRMPTRADYREKIWDHAAGKIVVEAAGGTVTDVFGRPLDFGHGRTLEENRGIVATSGAIHDDVVSAVRKVRGE
ncbi:MAG: 3'(2'),5'-bisphosphate nucleotidase [Deltaproteobacteria bacterium]|nr:3'(2'),5'-bisphosphate nucleotidase [Deltaproteobacteria bacterium]